ncbi:MAG TPA: amidase [Acidimicrobiales bacterium]|nr:amidase [Acidimicrobiales bacterium]
MTAANDLRWTDAVGQAELVRSGAIRARQLVDEAIERIDRLDPVIGALVTRRFDQARSEADALTLEGAPTGGQPFAGVPFLLKDAVQHSEGDRYQHGMGFLRDNPWRSPGDTELTRRYRAAGLIVLGRSKVPELTISPTTEPLAFGPTCNPWDPGRSPGGSSGGSAAAVASGMVPAAHGNDMGGSIRIPASCCGLVGLKPSRDRTSLAPDLGEYWGPLTHEHVLTRSVRDSAAILDATAGPVPGDLHRAPPPEGPWLDEVGRDPGRCRIGLVVDRPSGGPVDEECITAVEDAARLLEDLGHDVAPLAGGALFDSDGMAGVSTVIAAGIARDVGMWEERLGASATDLEPMPAAVVEAGRSLTAIQLIDAVDAIARWSRAIEAASATFDVLLSPTMAIVPPKLGTLSGDLPLADVFPGWSAMSAFALPFDASGQPAISLPLSWTAGGLPVGVQLVAHYGREDLLFRLASQLEVARPWADRHPAIAL